MKKLFWPILIILIALTLIFFGQALVRVVRADNGDWRKIRNQTVELDCPDIADKDCMWEYKVILADVTLTKKTDDWEPVNAWGYGYRNGLIKILLKRQVCD